MNLGHDFVWLDKNVVLLLDACVWVRARADARATFETPFVQGWSATGLNNPSVNLNHIPPDRRVFLQPNPQSRHAQQRRLNAARTWS